MSLLKAYMQWARAWEIDVALRYTPVTNIVKKHYKQDTTVLEVGSGGKVPPGPVLPDFSF